MALKRITIYIEEEYYIAAQEMAETSPHKRLRNVSAFMDVHYERITRKHREKKKGVKRGKK